MKIIVLAKLIPDTEISPRIASTNKDIVYEGLKMILNPYDEFAVEEAVKIASEKGGSAKVVTFGRQEADEALRTALAMGISDALRIDDPTHIKDSLRTAWILSKALSYEEFDIIFTGKQAFDDDASAVGAMVAEFLKLPFVSNIVKLTFKQDDVLEVHREAARGMEIIEVKMPCVLSCQKGLNKPRYPSLMGLMKAKKKQIPVKTLKDLEISEEEEQEFTGIEIINLSYPPSRKQGMKISGEPVEIASKLAIEIFKDKAIIV